YADGPPCNLQGPADPIAGVHATVALLAALEHRTRTGEGQLIEVAQIEVGAAVTAEPVIEASMTGRVREREGNRHRDFAQGVYPAAGDDEWIAISVRDDADWAVVADVIGRGDIATDPRFATPQSRLANHTELDEILCDGTRTWDADVLADNLTQRGVPAERILKADRMYDVAQLDARGFYQSIEHPVTGEHRYPGWPFRITPGPGRHHRAAPPTLGQHNDDVLAGLGLDQDAIAALREDQVIGERLLNA
ncbi:CoA transferase, partial [Micrococcus luteus]|uniref:CoA transferase n=1 Tax=Micrococcus luteus TaxID=1270 RepID=UPI0034402CFA